MDVDQDLLLIRLTKMDQEVTMDVALDPFLLILKMTNKIHTSDNQEL
jgi:hypothetical protein